MRVMKFLFVIFLTTVLGCSPAELDKPLLMSPPSELTDADIKELTSKAESGDIDAYDSLIKHYSRQDDTEKFLLWLKRKGDIGDEKAEAWYAKELADTSDTKERGLSLLFRAAERGNPWAAFYLNDGYSIGTYGLPKDPKEAQKWNEREQRIWKLRSGRRDL